MAGIKAQRTMSTNEKLNSVIEVLNNMLLSVQEMRDTEESMEKICRKHNIDWKPFRTSVILAIDRYIIDDSNIKPLSEIECPEEDPYITLFRAVAGISKESLNEYKLPEDLDETFEYIFANKNFSDREINIIRERFGLNDDERCKTLEEVGNIYGVTKDRIRQIEAKTIRRLRHPNNFNIIKIGKTAYEENLIVEAEAIKIRNKEKENRIKNKIDNIVKNNEYIEDDYTISDIICFIKSTSIGDIENISVRSYNALKRSGRNTLEDICLTTEDEFMKIRNLGRKSMEEIISIIDGLLNPYGYTYKSFLDMYESLDDSAKNITISIKSPAAMAILKKFDTISTTSEAKKLAKELYHLRDSEINDINSKINDAKKHILELNNEIRIKKDKINSLSMENQYLANRINMISPSKITDVSKGKSVIVDFGIVPAYLEGKDYTRYVAGMKILIYYLFYDMIYGKCDIADSFKKEAFDIAKSQCNNFDLEVSEFNRLRNLFIRRCNLLRTNPTN